MSRSPLIAAVIEAATSGIEVPAATIVRPITMSLTPSDLAIAIDAVTSHCEPNTSAARPAAISATCAGQVASQAPACAGRTSAAYSSFAAWVSRRDWTTRNTV